MKQAIVAALVTSASAFPWVVDVPGVDSSMLGSRHHRRQQVGEGAGGPASCPYNADHKPAAPYDARWPYAGAKNGAPGTGKGGYLVPALDDKAHQYVAPGKNDIRGPCPGLNTAANHNFLAHDGITTYTELVDAQQNVYNVGYDLANLLATLGLTLTDGDIVTQKLSIGCDATTRTSFNPILTGSEPGLDGHNKFEADASLTRNDFFTHGGDNFSFNRTLFDMMTQTTGGYFNREGLSKYRLQRYEQSRAENPNFFFGPLTLLLYGAASFLYELMPSGTNGYQPDYATIESFFVHERIPDNWTTRITPYSNMDVTNQIVTMYLENPVLFGGNTADGSFDAINFGAIKDGKIEAGISAKDTSCLLYQLATGNIPGYLNGLITPTVEALSFVATKLGPEFANLGCPIPLT